MFRCAILAMLLMVSPTLAEPIPKESEAAKIKRIWGEPLEKDNGAKFSLDGEKLRISVPKCKKTSDNDLLISEPENATRIVKKVEGPFVVTVTLHHHKPPEKCPEANPMWITGAGIYVKFESSVYGFGRVHNDESLKTKGTATSFYYKKIDDFRVHRRNWEDIHNEKRFDPIKLKVEIEGKWIRSYFSFDGKIWENAYMDNRNISSKAIVGIYAEHTVDAETTAVFEDFKITKPK